VFTLIIFVAVKLMMMNKNVCCSHCNNDGDENNVILMLCRNVFLCVCYDDVCTGLLEWKEYASCLC
jgi:hypothetical protein